MRRRHRFAVLATLACLTACTTRASGPVSNGIATLPGKAILQTALANAERQSTFAISGNGSCPQGPYVVNMRLDRNGNATGTVQFASGTMTLVRAANALYVHASAAFWTANASAQAATQIGTKWVISRNPAANTCLWALTSFDDVLANFVDLPGAVTRVGPGVALGQQAVTLQLPIATMWVATRGTALPIRVDSTVSEQAGQTQPGISFGLWNGPVPLSVPSSADTISATAVAHA